MVPIFFMFEEAETIYQQLLYLLTVNLVNKISLAFVYAKKLSNFIKDFGIDGFNL